MSGNIVCVSGMPGKAKTATAVYIVYKLYYKQGRKVISNTPLAIKHEFIETISMCKEGCMPPELDNIIEQQENVRQRAGFLWDEAHTWVDCREAMTKKNIVITEEFITQMRKLGIDCYYTVQDWVFVDPRVRRLTSHLVYCQEFHKGVMHGDLYEDPWHKPNQRPDELWLLVKPVFSLFDTYYRVKRPRAIKHEEHKPTFNVKFDSKVVPTPASRRRR